MKGIFKISWSKLKKTESSDSVQLQESLNYEMLCHLVCDLGNQLMKEKHQTLANDDDQGLLVEDTHIRHFNHNVISNCKEETEDPNETGIELQILQPLTRIQKHNCIHNISDIDQVIYVETCDKIYQYYRTKLKKHSTRRLTLEEFETDWEYVTRLFNILGVSSEEIENYKFKQVEVDRETVKRAEGDDSNQEDTEQKSVPIDTNSHTRAYVKISRDPRKIKERNELCVIILLSAIFICLAILFFILLTKHKNTGNIKELLVILALLIIIGFPMFRCIVKRQIKEKNKYADFKRRYMYRDI